MKKFEERFARFSDELKELYLSLYEDNTEAYEDFCAMLKKAYTERKPALRKIDDDRLANPDWLYSNKHLGMMLYVNNFAGNLQGVRKKLSYIEECGVNYIHLMPLLKSPKGRSDGGYAVADFRTVQPELGTIKDLEALADDAHKKGMSLCLDFVMNHTSEDHEWAKAARAGDEEAKQRYFFYDNWDIPNEFEKTVPQVFPTTAPGSFTYLEDCDQIVMTSFYPYQWDLNYANPKVFNDMMDNMFFLINKGMDVIRVDATPYIWKELGTTCRNLPQVHTISRIMHIICEIVCPSVLLLGEVVMEPSKLAPYFGSEDKPECHMLYNATTMCTTWNTIATKDTRLLRYQMDQLSALPHSYLFQNYIRCHDDIGWGLDYKWLEQLGQLEVPHKKFLNDWFLGKFEGSSSVGALYNDDPRLGDARMCGTTASLVGIETAEKNKDKDALELAIDCDLMLHAWVFSQSGIPVLYSGDEIAQLNDHSYIEDPDKVEDSRYLHRGAFNWKLAENRKKAFTRQGKVFSELRKLEKVRAEEELFRADADVQTVNLGDNRLFCISRKYNGKKLFCIFNFSPEEIQIHGGHETYTDILTEKEVNSAELTVKPYGFYWLKK
ncbi:MAG: amylosucrase [Clostridia bacterium]|nr:amylosucrase [Clostridia bacterium]